jgi:hypothetical protein
MKQNEARLVRTPHHHKYLQVPNPYVTDASTIAHQDVPREGVPMFLRHNEVERGGYGQNAPIRYAPEQEMKSDVSNVTNSISLPGNSKTYLKVWNGKGYNESFLNL